MHIKEEEKHDIIYVFIHSIKSHYTPKPIIKILKLRTERKEPEHCLTIALF